ncbi:MAG: hypothetical protein NVSMB45_13150 [Ginsengibacter sp.]
MEHFYEDGFEKYLKEQADQFKIEPSKKAWHGIYNNFHPGRRWPSAATGLMIILLLTLTNNLNTRQQRELLEKYSASANADKKPANKHPRQAQKTSDDDMDFSTIRDMIALLTPQDISAVDPTTLIPSSLETAKDAVQPAVKNVNPAVANTIAQPLVSKDAKKLATETATEKIILNNTVSVEESKSYNPISNLPVESLQKPLANNLSQKNYLDNIEDLKAKIKKVRKNPLHFSYYVSPTLNYRTLTKVDGYMSPNINSIGQYVEIGNKGVYQHIAPGLEAGSAFSFKLAKKLEFLGGLQINYSGYNITASYIHPIISSLLLINNGVAQPVPAISYFSNDNTQSKVTLHSYNIESSIPIGLNYQFFKNDRISFNAVSSLAPTLILFQRSYLLSADTKNYVSSSDLIRNFNLNAELGVYMGFNINKTKYQIGPQFRSQMLSNFKSNAPYSEHLLNYGIRFTISK